MAAFSSDLNLVQKARTTTSTASASVKSLVKRFEALAKYSSVPNVRGSFLLSEEFARYQKKSLFTQQGEYLQISEENFSQEEEEETSQTQSRERQLIQVQGTFVQKGLRRCSSEVGLMSVSGLPSLGMQGMDNSGLQLLRTVSKKSRSPCNALLAARYPISNTLKTSLDGTEKSPEVEISEEDSLKNTSSTTHCISAPRLVLRRLGQSVKRRASFFIEQSQKQEDLPLRKSPPPKRLLNVDGENMGKKVSRKVKDKIEAVKRASEEQNKIVAIGREKWNRRRRNQSSTDGADDNTSSSEFLLARDHNMGVRGKSVGTEASSSWSSTGYPLIAPTTPPVMRRIQSQFLYSLLKKSFKPPVELERDGTADDEQALYKSGPRLTPEVKQMPQRDDGSAETLGFYKLEPIAGKGSLGGGKLKKPWKNWSGAGRKGKDDNIRTEEVGDRDESVSFNKLRITPPRISVRSLIARFRQAEDSEGVAETARRAYMPLKRRIDHSIEVQFDEDMEQEQGIRKGKPRRSLSIRAFTRTDSTIGERPTTRSATYTFQEDEGEATNGEVSRKLHAKPYFHSGNGKRSFRLRITPNSKEKESEKTVIGTEIAKSTVGCYAESHISESNSAESQNSNSEQRSIGSMFHSYSAGMNSGSIGNRRNSESSGTDYSPPSLTSTETIVTTKNSLRSHRQSYRYAFENEISGSRDYKGTSGTNEQRWSGNSEEVTHSYTSGTEGETWHKMRKRSSIVTDEDSVDGGVPIEQGAKRQYRYQTYGAPRPLEPVAVYNVTLQSPSDVDRSMVHQNREGYRGTPAPENFILGGELAEKCILQARGQDMSSGSYSEGMSDEGEYESYDDEYDDSSPETDQLGYVYVDDNDDNNDNDDDGDDGDEVEDKELDEVVSDSGSDIGGYFEGEEEEGEEDGEEEDGDDGMKDDYLSFEEEGDKQEEHVGYWESNNLQPEAPTEISGSSYIMCNTLRRGYLKDNIEFTPPPVINNTDYRHHRRQLAPTAHYVNGTFNTSRPARTEESGQYPMLGTESERRRFKEKHETACQIVSTILWEGVEMVKSRDDIEVVGLDGDKERWLGRTEFRNSMGREGYWWGAMESEREARARKLRVEFPVRGMHFSEKVVQPKPRSLVLKREIEKFVAAWS